jgi:quinol monooxygenase YgiN
VRLEPGVVANFPLRVKEHQSQMRILEIYSSRDAYESHLQTPHFLRYKTATLNMVNSLTLIDMNPLDEQAIRRLFRKAQCRRRRVSVVPMRESA